MNTPVHLIPAGTYRVTVTSADGLSVEWLRNDIELVLTGTYRVTVTSADGLSIEWLRNDIELVLSDVRDNLAAENESVAIAKPCEKYPRGNGGTA